MIANRVFLIGTSYLKCIKNIALPLVLATAGCKGFDFCGNEMIAEYPSPDRTVKVVVFQRDCGATTSFSTQASLLNAEAVLGDSGGIIFAADTSNSRAPATARGGPELMVAWEGNKRVNLAYHPQARVFIRMSKFNDIEITYSSLGFQ